MSIISQLIDTEVVKYGDFTLKSGAKSKIYFDLRSIIAKPGLLHSVSYQLRDLIYQTRENNKYNTNSLDLTSDICVIGVPTGAVPIAAILADKMNMPMAMVRDAPKDHGLGKQVEGSEAKNVILIEDVITTGGSVDKYAKILEDAGRKIALVVCILDREAGGVTELKKKYRVASLVKMSDFSHPQVVQNFLDRRNAKQSNLVVALDNSNPDENLRIAELVAPYVAAFKLHYDLYQFEEVVGVNTRDNFINHLRILKAQHNFAIIEDRKFADIAAICVKQWQALPEDYKKIVDAVTVHPVCGPDVVDALGKEVPLLLIHQLSTKGNLICSCYSECIVNSMAPRSSNVVGFISQSRVTNNGYPIHPYLTFSPGVNLDATTDGQGQQWSATKNTDFVIVGRGITEAKDPATESKRYRDTFWKAN